MRGHHSEESRRNEEANRPHFVDEWERLEYFIALGVLDLDDKMSRVLDAVSTSEEQFMLDLAPLIDAVNKNTDVEASATQLLNVVVDQLRGLQTTDPQVQAEVDDMIAKLTEATGPLAAAVANAQGDPNAPSAPAEGGIGANAGDPGSTNLPAPTPDTGDTTGTPVTDTPTGGDPGTETPNPSSPPPVYTTDLNADQVDASWQPIVGVTSDGKALYVFTQDVAGQAPQGDGAGGVWHLYTGEVVAPSA